ncbi:unnamed protein product [Owenia fusiformis]|uniref:Uncharacterized protein n=1 Tax=Owenia fusiformis TaxID=6347 RepID=A0A8J1T551_OWEFU|nr:unnamed protein product [Owenia fusiformis]
MIKEPIEYIKFNETTLTECIKIAKVAASTSSKESVIAEEHKQKDGQLHEGVHSFQLTAIDEESKCSKHTPDVQASCKGDSQTDLQDRIYIEMLPRTETMDSDSLTKQIANNSNCDPIDQRVNNTDFDTEDQGMITSINVGNDLEFNSVDLAGDKDSEESSDSDGTNCRICACSEDTGESLISAGCNCKGYLEFCHKSCLETWIRAQRSNRCELCRAVFSGMSQLPGYEEDAESYVSTTSSFMTSGNVRGARACFIMTFFILLAMTITSGLLLTRTIKMKHSSYNFQPSMNSEDHNFILTISLSIFIVSICCTMFISICWFTWEVSYLCYWNTQAERDRRVLQDMVHIIDGESVESV